MYRVWLLILLLGVSNCIGGEPRIAVVTWEESYNLYKELAIEDAISYQAFQEALAGYRKYSTEEGELLALIDFTKASTDRRFCVVDVINRRVLFESHVSHGRNSGDNYAVSFSNEPGSNKSSLGFFRTGSTYMGKNGYSLLLDGLEKGLNDKAKERAIVIHGANYANPTLAQSQGRLGRSLGCPALPPAISRKVIDTIKDGALLYIYGKNRA